MGVSKRHVIFIVYQKKSSAYLGGHSSTFGYIWSKLTYLMQRLVPEIEKNENIFLRGFIFLQLYTIRA
jgi:hypothetical protein